MTWKTFVASHPIINPYRLSAFARMLPNFLIIGAGKSGTTSLFNYLLQHPRIKPPRKKEIHYFDVNYNKGLQWYKAYFPIISPNKITFEATSNYLETKQAPKIIHDLLPNVKLILVLRNPTDRAYSHYQNSVRNGTETLSFQDALKTNKAYIDGSMYGEHLKHWVEYFPKKQFFIMKYQELTKHFNEIFDFLGIENYPINTQEQFKVGGDYPQMEIEIRKKLDQIFEESNKELFKVTEINFIN